RPGHSRVAPAPESVEQPRLRGDGRECADRADRRADRARRGAAHDARRAGALRERGGARPAADRARGTPLRVEVAGGRRVTYFRAVDPFPLESADHTKLHEFYTRLASERLGAN